MTPQVSEISAGNDPQPFPALVAEVVDEFRVVVNRGALHGVKLGTRFLLYSLSDQDILDPSTGDSLGRLELVKGTGTVTHVQERMATIESDRIRQPQRKLYGTALYGSTAAALVRGLSATSLEEHKDEKVPFNNPRLSDWARPI